MADDNTLDTDAGATTSSEAAQQNLDDLTVLTNVSAPNLGETRLNVTRSVEIDDGKLGALATVHQGSTAAPASGGADELAVGDGGGRGIVVDAVGEGGGIAAIPPLVVAATEGALSATAYTPGEISGEAPVAPDSFVPPAPAPQSAVETVDAEIAGEAPAAAEPVVPAQPAEIPAAAAVVPADELLPAADAAANLAPVVEGSLDLGAFLTEDTSTFLSKAALLANASDADGDALDVVDAPVATDADGNAVAATFVPVEENGVVIGWTVTPPENYNGSDIRLSYQVTDGTTAVDATAVVDVTSVNDGPVAGDNALALATEEGTPLTIDASALLGNDSDVDGDTLSITTVALADAGQGSLTLGADGNLSFVPGAAMQELGAGESATVSFDYTISDGHGGSDTATASFTVTGSNDGPVVSGAVDLGSVVEDTGTFISTASLLGTASDADGDTLSVADLVATDADGTVVGSFTAATDADGAPGFTFVPSADFAGDLRVSYTVSDGTATTAATATIAVTNVNDAPVFGGIVVDGEVVDPPLSVAEDRSIRFGIDVSDADGEAVSIDVAQPAHGSVSIDPQSGELIYTPTGDYFGTDTIQVSLTDASGTTTLQSIPVTVDGVQDGPVAADDLQLAATEEGTPLTIAASRLLGNDSDADGDAIALTGVEIADPNQGSVAIDDAGNVVFTPGADMQGLGAGESATVSFDYTISDGHGGRDTATASFTVTGSNDGPVVSGAVDLGAMVEDGSRFISTASLLGTATDADGDTLSVGDLVARDAAGTVVGSFTAETVDGVAGFRFAPNADYNGENVQVGYTVSDGTATTQG
ncbi:MAG: cadherin-like domain-containing protein, partial [Magnetospirillum sp.]|nr:cadherin-like domain-containing protein [Magnetospirillum sp.]